MNFTYFVADDAYGDPYVWRAEEGREDLPEPIVGRHALDDAMWKRLTDGMEYR